MVTEKRANEIFGGTFLIGLAVLFLINWWWPGIMFVIGIALLARAVAQGRNWMDERAGLVAIAIGVVFTALSLFSFAFNLWPIILILIGLYMLFGNSRGGGWRNGWRGGWGGKNGGWRGGNDGENEKSKHDDFV